MTTDRTHRTRRTVLTATGGLLTLALAGCVSSPAATGGESPDAEAAQTNVGPDGDGGDDEHHGDDADVDGHHDDDDVDDHHDGATDDHHGDTDHHAIGTQDESQAHDEEIGDPVQNAEVLMTTSGSGFHFEPHIVRVNVGGTVTWANESGAHSATAYHPDNDRPRLVPEGTEGWDSGLLTAEGETYERAFETEGVYHYFCIPHEATGMISTVIVGEPDAHGRPALEASLDSLPGYAPDKIASLNERVNEALGHSNEE